jgi:hypothetical protein
MERGLRRRWWLEVALTAASAAVVLASLIWPTWVEHLVGIPPDGGSGELSSLVALTALATAILGAWSSHRAWREMTASETGSPAVAIPDAVDVGERVTVARR